MDSKTNERVIDVILKYKSSQNVFNNPVETLQKYIPDLSKEVIEASIENLGELNHLEVHAGDEIFYVIVKPSAIGYLRKLKEERENAAKKRTDDRN